jgi:hypothetical protein
MERWSEDWPPLTDGERQRMLSKQHPATLTNEEQEWLDRMDGEQMLAQAVAAVLGVLIGLVAMWVWIHRGG